MNRFDRQAIDEWMQQEIELSKTKKSTFSVLLLNIDRFKLINYSYGWNFGDGVLLEVYNNIRTLVGERGSVMHNGGDDFLIIVKNTGLDQGVVFGNEILQELEQPLIRNGTELRITVSAGLTTFPLHGTDAEKLLRNVNIALYMAKQKGGNELATYSANLGELADEWLDLYNDLPAAIHGEQFYLLYQPKVTVPAGEIVGVEALLRWEHPMKGVIPPSIFIPIAEQTNFIQELGKWVLLSACKQAKQWHDNGVHTTIAINISAKQIQSRNFVQAVKAVIEETNAEGSWLEFEITEQLFIDNVYRTKQTLQRLREMGIKISVDDFGTGYSSLSYIQQFPIDALKIDRAFVADLQSQTTNKLVSTIIELGHHLHLRVIAEGVETKEQLLYLQERGCDEWQGYLFSRPISSEQIEQLFALAKYRSLSS